MVPDVQSDDVQSRTVAKYSRQDENTEQSLEDMNLVLPVQNNQEQRRSSRDRKPPPWMKEFVPLNVQEGSYALSNYVSYEGMSTSYQASKHVYYH